MGKVIVRHGTTIDDEGYIHHDDREISWFDAKRRAGFKLDRRKNWAFIEGQLCESVQWTQSCSGCSCDCGCMGSHGASGCRECGYQGKVRNGAWVPYSPRLNTR